MSELSDFFSIFNILKFSKTGSKFLQNSTNYEDSYSSESNKLDLSRLDRIGNDSKFK